MKKKKKQKELIERDRYRNMTEIEKNRLKEYKKHYRKINYKHFL